MAAAIRALWCRCSIALATVTSPSTIEASIEKPEALSTRLRHPEPEIDPARCGAHVRISSTPLANIDAP